MMVRLTIIFNTVNFHPCFIAIVANGKRGKYYTSYSQFYEESPPQRSGGPKPG